MHLPPELENTKGISNFVTLESAAFPGHFLASIMPAGNRTGAPELGIVRIPYGFGPEKEAFGGAATFQIDPPLATHPPVAFWGRGLAGRNFLVRIPPCLCAPARGQAGGPRGRW